MLAEILNFQGAKPCLGVGSFSYKNFIYHEGIEEEPLGEHLDELEPLRAMYHKLYEQAKVDHSIRTDLSEQELFTTVAIAMLAVAERYAQGIVWANDHKTDHTQELKYLKEMLLMWCKGKTE